MLTNATNANPRTNRPTSVVASLDFEITDTHRVAAKRELCSSSATLLPMHSSLNATGKPAVHPPRNEPGTLAACAVAGVEGDAVSSSASRVCRGE